MPAAGQSAGSEQPFGLQQAVGLQQPFGLQQRSDLQRVAVRRCLLAVSVLHDLDISWDDDVPHDGDGVPNLLLDGPPAIHVPAARLKELLAGRDPEHPTTVERVARWLLLRRALFGVPAELVVDSLRVVGLPVDHAAHPGVDWTRSTVPGGALTLGLGLLPDFSPDGMPAKLNQEPADLLDGTVPLPAAAAPVPLPEGLLAEVGIDASTVWPRALARLDELGGLAAARRRRRPRDPLRPLGEADVVTLLGSRHFRFELANETAMGLAALVVPMLTRGWVSSAAIDSAFGPAAAAATAEHQRGFARPLLITEYEVVQVPSGGHPLRYLGDQKPRSPYS